MNIWHIHIKGRVQGVGFRPYVHRLAQERGLKGVVYNGLDGVHVKFSGSEGEAKEFDAILSEYPPPLSKITEHRLIKEEGAYFEDFRILQNQEENAASLLLPPDFAICENCKKELFQTQNRRAYYPFITCTQCGPRYSILKKIPFERAFTAMNDYEMCSSCKREYIEPKDRRYHSQTNSCQECGIQMRLINSDREEIETDSRSIVKKIAGFWKEGKIIAIKGIGGYLLSCDASNKDAIQLLRQRKFRPTKPFACMYPGIEAIQAEFDIHSDEVKSLTSEVAPVLLAKIKSNLTNIAYTEIAPGLDQIGVMLPYTPLYELVLYEFNSPIVATSGNLSNAAIVFEDAKMFSELSGIWDYVLVNDLDIVSSQDDSVMRYSSIKKQPIIIRRSRGLAPNYFGPIASEEKKTILALGASQKSAFGLLFEGVFYLSQYLGDLSYWESAENFEKTLAHYMVLLNCKPDLILVDAHPDYYSTQYGQRLAASLDIKLVKVQHHHAHFGAILSEQNLLNQQDKVLGVIWDGAGYGNDQNIWGGEFLTYWKGDFKRVSHLSYSPYILGDKMSLEPRISALAYCWGNNEAMKLIRGKFNEKEWSLYSKILKKQDFPQTSSMGRLFDAVASLLGLIDVQTYEGEAALRLETLAQSYYEQGNIDYKTHYISQISYIKEIPIVALIEGIVKDLKNGEALNLVAFKFHNSLIKIVEKIAKANNSQKIAFSGGVFQNGMLVDLMLMQLGDNFQLYFHKEVSPNDENIALGQLAYYQIKKRDEISK